MQLSLDSGGAKWSSHRRGKSGTHHWGDSYFPILQYFIKTLSDSMSSIHPTSQSSSAYHGYKGTTRTSPGRKVRLFSGTYFVMDNAWVKLPLYLYSPPLSKKWTPMTPAYLLNTRTWRWPSAKPKHQNYLLTVPVTVQSTYYLVPLLPKVEFSPYLSPNPPPWRNT